jgi:hypothetical protein
VGFKERNLKLYEEKVGVVEVLPSASLLSHCEVAERRYLHRKGEYSGCGVNEIDCVALIPHDSLLF